MQLSQSISCPPASAQVFTSSRTVSHASRGFDWVHGPLHHDTQCYRCNTELGQQGTCKPVKPHPMQKLGKARPLALLHTYIVYCATGSFNSRIWQEKMQALRPQPGCSSSRSACSRRPLSLQRAAVPRQLSKPRISPTPCSSADASSASTSGDTAANLCTGCTEPDLWMLTSTLLCLSCRSC